MAAYYGRSRPWTHIRFGKYWVKYHMLSCIVQYAIMHLTSCYHATSCYYATICYHAKYNLLSCNISFASCNISFASWDISFAIMQIILCYHAGYHMLLCGVLTFYHNYYQPPRLTYYHQVIIIAPLGALPFDLTGTYNSAIWVWIGMAIFFMIEILISWYRLIKPPLFF